MILRRIPWIALLGLGAVAGAVLPDAAGAQVPVRRDTTVVRRDTAGTRIDTTGGRRTLSPSGRDTVRIPLPPRTDTLVAGDSTRRGLVPLPDVPKADTIKAPLARAEAPPILEIDGARIYDRTALFATGVSTLIELLGRVPGLTEYATGFLGAPAAIASQGDLRHVRIFLDGLEMDPMDVRSRGTSAVGDLPIHALEEVRIERGAEEVRVYARSWRVDRTVPYTRGRVKLRLGSSRGRTKPMFTFLFCSGILCSTTHIIQKNRADFRNKSTLCSQANIGFPLYCVKVKPVCRLYKRKLRYSAAF